MKLSCPGVFARIAVTALVGFIASVASLADDAVEIQTAETQVESPVASKSAIFGNIDLRAEYMTQHGALDTSNYLQFGYQFNPDLKVSWYQGFDSNLYKSTLSGPNGGLNAVWDQGFLRTRVGNLWQQGNLSLAYESRIYAPTWKVDIDQGNITRFYNALKLIDKVNDTVTLTAVEVVMPEVFRTAGTPDAGANPGFENRIYLVADFNITSKLTLDFPILAYQTRYRNYQVGAKNNDSWGNIVYIWPELDYAVTEHLTFGLAFVSDNLVKPDMSGLTLDTGLKNGTVQFVVTTSL